MGVSITNPYNSRKILFHHTRLKEILKGKKNPYPITIEVDLVDGVCNSCCPHCCFPKFGSKPVFIKKKPLFNAISNAKEKGVRAVEFVGGTEPTMHKDINLIIKTTADIGLEVGLITNGILLERVFSIASKLTFLRVSLDAGTREMYYKTHGVDCFLKVVENIKQLAKYYLDPEKIGLAFLCLPNNSSFKEIRLATELAVRYKLGYIVFRPAILPENWDRKYLSSIEEKISRVRKEFDNQINIFSSVSGRWQSAREKKRQYQGPCLGCNLTGIIMADGNVPFCNLFRRKKKLYLGNIYGQTFSEIWEGERHKKFLRSVNVFNCPVPCKADDYRKIMFDYKRDLFQKDCNLPKVLPRAHPNFI